MERRTRTLADSIKVQHTVGNTTVIESQPGNGSRYVLHVTDLRALRDAPEGVPGCRCFTVALLTDGHGTVMTVADTGNYLSADYVAEKLRLSSRADAEILAELIAHVTGRKAEKVGP